MLLKYSKFHFNLSDDNTTRFINSGIAYKDVVSTPDDRRSAIEKENYPMAGESTVVSGTQFAVYSYISGAKFTSKDLAENIYTSNNSFTTKPLVNIKNYGAEPDANDTTSPYCYYKNNTLNIGVKPNDSYTINISDLVSITKYGRNIDFSLNVNGDAVINDKFITFDCTGTYLIDVNYSDNIIYDLLGNHTNITKDYTHSILAIVSNVEIPKPELIFDSEKVATAALHIADNDLYNKYVDLCDFYFAFKVLDCLSISYNGNTTSYSGSKSMPTGLTVAMSSYGQSIGGGNTYTKFGIVNDKDLVFHSDNKSNKIVSKDVKFTIQYKYAIEGITSVYKNVEFTLKKSSSVIKYSKYKSLTINSTHILNK